MGFFKRHRNITAILGFLIITAPTIIEAWWGLYEKFTRVSMPSLNLSFGIWLLPLIGLIFAISILWQGRHRQGHRRTISKKGQGRKKEDVIKIHIPDVNIPIDSEMKRNIKRVKYAEKKLRKSIGKTVHNYFEKDNKI